MESELAVCPICGASVLPTFVGLHANTASCFKGECLYRVRAEEHNTLARRAEIGALVERITGADNMLKVWIDKGDPWTAESYKPEGLGYTRVQRQSTTLLDALRALAAELEVSGERS